MMPFLNVNGCNFYYEMSGDGPDLVFIHGEIHGIEYWEHQIPEFSRDHRCFRYYRRGHGKTQITDYGFSLTNQTRDLAELMTCLGIKRPVMIAVAFGTTIAVNYAIHNPDNVCGIVLVAWSELHQSMEYFQRWAKYNMRAVEILESGGKEAFVNFLRKEGGKSVYMVIPVDSPIREKCIQMFANHPVEEFKRGMLEFGSSVPDLVQEFRKLDIPVIGLCGENDPYRDKPEVLQGMKNFKELNPIPGASRFVQWDHPLEFNKILREFLTTIGH
jgi:pimeloyl-ACP methyl ester carboxylesterase